MSEDYKEPSRNNVILFPKTHDYYQIELTRMLESERYGEAIALLQFLLTCDGEDARIREEGDALLQWLVSAFPEAERDARELDIPEGLAGWTKSTAEEESEETEQDILRRQFQQMGKWMSVNFLCWSSLRQQKMRGLTKLWSNC